MSSLPVTSRSGSTRSPGIHCASHVQQVDVHQARTHQARVQKARVQKARVQKARMQKARMQKPRMQNPRMQNPRMHGARASLTACVLSLVVLAGCADDRVGVSPPRPAPLPVASNAWFVVSDSTAVAGREVSIAAFASSDSGGAIGSFTARFLYDSLQLQVLGPDSIADRAMRAINPIAGEHRIAGAAADGLPGGLLFRLRARVIDPRGLHRLGLVIDEMHSVKFADLTSKLEVRDTRAALFAGTPGLKVQPVQPVQPVEPKRP